METDIHVAIRVSFELEGEEIILFLERRNIMPGFDGTGPMGQGTMTGGGFGNCVPYASMGLGRGYRNAMGRGFRGNSSPSPGGGRGRRCCFPTNFAPPLQQNLKAEIEVLKSERMRLDQMISNFENQITGDQQ